MTAATNSTISSKRRLFSFSRIISFVILLFTVGSTRIVRHGSGYAAMSLLRRFSNSRGDVVVLFSHQLAEVDVGSALVADGGLTLGNDVECDLHKDRSLHQNYDIAYENTNVYSHIHISPPLFE